MDKKLFSIIFVLASVMALVHFYSCTSAEDEFVEELDSLAERRMTRSSMESSAGDDTGGDSGEDVEIDYPSADEILNAVSGEMSAAWSETLAACTSEGRQEFGFYIYYDVKEKRIFAGNLVSGPLIPRDQTTNAEIDMGSYTETENIKVCGVFHTHTSLQYARSHCERSVGPSDVDLNHSKARGLPGFVYDYVSKVYNGTPKTSPAKIYTYGPSRRKKPSN